MHEKWGSPQYKALLEKRDTDKQVFEAMVGQLDRRMWFLRNNDKAHL